MLVSVYTYQNVKLLEISCCGSFGNNVFQIPVEDRNTQAEEEEEETFCEVCQQSDREDRMLLCDGCDLG